MIPSLRNTVICFNLTQYMVNHPNMIGRGRSGGRKKMRKIRERREMNGEEGEWGGKRGRDFFSSPTNTSSSQKPHTCVSI